MSALPHRKVSRYLRFWYGYFQFFDHFIGRPRFFRWTKKSRTRFYKKLEANLKKGGPGKEFAVERRDNLTRDEFMNEYVRKGKPVIITGAAKDWVCATEWSLEYFKNLHGDDKVVFMDQRDIATGYEETTLGKVIDDIRGGTGKYYRFYPLLEKHPEHLLDFDYKWLRARRLRGNFGEAFHVFISGKGGFTPIHNASSPNIFVQCYGEKKWIMHPMEYACVVDPSPARNMYRSAPIRNGKDFDPFQKNFTDYPLYQYVDYYTVHLKAGDVFYNPPYMWHSVYNPTDSIGVGYRYFAPLHAMRLKPLYMFLELFAFNPPIWMTYRNYSDINLIHLIETGMLDEVAKKSGKKKLTSTVDYQ
jgi:hypothetical protein